MAPVRDELAKLKETAAALNRETDELNATIEDLEDQIAQTGIGLSVWLDDPENCVARNDEGYDDGLTSAWMLGYTRIGDQWRVAVRQVVLEVDHSDGYMGEIEKIASRHAPMPLLKASRQVRAESAPMLEYLVAALRVRGDEIIEGVHVANKVASE